MKAAAEMWREVGPKMLPTISLTVWTFFRR